MPVALSFATFRLEDIKQIKNCVGGIVNDVLTEIIFYGMQRYLQIRLLAVGEHSLQDAYEKRFEMPKDVVIKQMKNSRLTTLCMINMTSTGLQNIDEMLNPEAKVPWGNHLGFLSLRVPLMGTLENPLDFMRSAKRNLDMNKMSFGAFLKD